MLDEFLPPASFYFSLQFSNAKFSADNAFQEAAGLSVEMEVEEIREGGQNMYKHRLPTGAKYGNLVLKRGFVSHGSKLAVWCEATTTTDFSRPIETYDVLLRLLDASGFALATWAFLDAYPVKWSLSDFRAQESALAIETLEFAYSMFRRE